MPQTHSIEASAKAGAQRTSPREQAKYVPHINSHLRTTILVIQPKSLFRDCMVDALRKEEDLEVLAVASMAEVATLEKRSAVSVVLLSGVPDQVDGTNSTNYFESLSKEMPSAAVVMISDSCSLDKVVAAVSSGARGIIPYDTKLTLAIEILRLVAAGGTYIPADSLLAASRGAREPQEIKSPSSALFTPKQSKVVEALRRGKSNKAIAYELNMCESTVKVHVRNIMKRLNAKNRTEVAYLAQKLIAGGDLNTHFHHP